MSSQAPETTAPIVSDLLLRQELAFEKRVIELERAAWQRERELLIKHGDRIATSTATRPAREYPVACFWDFGESNRFTIFPLSYLRPAC